MKVNTKPGRPSPNDQSNLDNLASLGIKVDPVTGAVSSVDDSFEGSASLAGSAPEAFGTTSTTTTTQTVLPGEDRLEFGDEGEDPVVIEPEHSAPAPKAPGAQTEEGLAKREADARKAQQDLSKAQLKLDNTVKEVNKKIADLDERIQQFSTLQVTSGGVPPDMNPAEPELVEQWRNDESTAEGVRVIEAIVAPAYARLSQLSEQVQAVVKRMGEFFSEMKENEVFTGVYSKIPKDRVQQITESPEFITWLSGKPRSKRELYLDIINNTSNYSAEEALEVFDEFASATGFDLGTGSAPAPRAASPAMDTSPRLRSGSALPEAPEPPRRPATDALTPLSMAELATFGRDIQNVTPAEAAILRKRFDLTQSFSVDGNSHAQTAFNGRL